MVPLGPSNGQDDDERRGEDDVGEEDEERVLEARLIVVAREGVRVRVDVGFVVAAAGGRLGGLDPLGLLFLLSEADEDGDAEGGGEEVRDDAYGRDDVAGLGAGDDAEDEGGEEAGGGDAAEGSLVGHWEGGEGAVEAGVWDGGEGGEGDEAVAGLEEGCRLWVAACDCCLGVVMAEEVGESRCPSDIEVKTPEDPFLM